MKNITKKGVTFNVSDSCFQLDWWKSKFPQWENETYDRIVPCLDNKRG